MELGAAGYAAAGAAAAGGVGVGLFGYNRGNYMMDQKHLGYLGLSWSQVKTVENPVAIIVTIRNDYT